MTTAWIFPFLDEALYGVFGNLTLVGISIFAMFLFILVWRGVDFRYALMLLTPGLVSVAEGGWFPQYIAAVLWFFVVGFGLYLGWKAITPSY